MKYLELKSFTTLTLSLTAVLLFILTACDDKTGQKISIVKSERTQEKHPEVAIQKEDNDHSIKTDETKDVFKEITEKQNNSSILDDTVLPLSELNKPSSSSTYGITGNQQEISKNILSIIDSNKGHKKRPLRIVYFNPKDRKPVAGYQQRIQKIMLELQSFYGKGMEQNGFGYRTFDLEMKQGHLKIHFIQSQEPSQNYSRDSKTSQQIYSMTADKFKENGIDIEKETVIAFQNLAKIDADSFYDTSAPYYGTWNTNKHRKGFCYVVDSEYLNWKNLSQNKNKIQFNGTRTMTTGELASGQIGGVCHELGHAFCLNHTHSDSVQNQKFGTALMGYGNWTFKQELRQEGKGTYLSFVSAAKLIGHPCFSPLKSGSHNLQIMDISFNSMNSILEIHGSILSSPDVYAVIAYCDDTANKSDYDATGWVGTVDNMGKFQLSINELKPNKSYQLNLQFLFVNGNESTEQITINTNATGIPSLEEAVREKIILRPAIQAKLKNNRSKSDKILKELTSSNNSRSVKFLANTIKVMDKPQNKYAGNIPDSIKEIYLSQIKWDSGLTGYSSPRNNRVQEDNTQNPWPFLASSQNIHRFGLYAHANSEYTYKLDAKWKTLKGKCALRNKMKGSVKFIIKGDGKELFNSGNVTDSKEYKYNISVKDISTIQLIVTDSGDGKNSDWGQWLSPKLSR